MSENLHLLSSNKKILALFNQGCVFCAFDTETSGQNPNTSGIIEIGAVKFTKDKILEKFSSLVKISEPLNGFITDLTGITDEMLKPAPPPLQVITEFRKFCRDTVLVAHNAQFDLRFVNEESRRLGFLPLSNSAVDTLRLSRLMLPENGCWKQTFLADQFNIDKGHAHRALDDATVCAELFKILIHLPVPPKKKRQISKEYSPYSQQARSLAEQALS